MFDWIQSLGLRTDLFFLEREGILEDRGEYGVVRTPSNPDYYFGNSLVVSAPPRTGDFERWMDWFAEEFTDATHRVFQCDGVTGETGADGPFLEAGFRIETMEVLTTRRLRDNGKTNSSLDIRRLESDQDWQELLELRLAVAAKDEQRDSESHLDFARLRFAFYRRIVEDGLGAWWGAFESGRLLGGLGLFGQGNVARFQRVDTHPDARRRGVCSTLVWNAAQDSLDRHPGRTLVMQADESYHAKEIYRSLGFELTERILNFVREPND